MQITHCTFSLERLFAEFTQNPIFLQRFAKIMGKNAQKWLKMVYKCGTIYSRPRKGHFFKRIKYLKNTKDNDEELFRR